MLLPGFCLCFSLCHIAQNLDIIVDKGFGIQTAWATNSITHKLTFCCYFCPQHTFCFIKLLQQDAGSKIAELIVVRPQWCVCLLFYNICNILKSKQTSKQIKSYFFYISEYNYIWMLNRTYFVFCSDKQKNVNAMINTLIYHQASNIYYCEIL